MRDADQLNRNGEVSDGDSATYATMFLNLPFISSNEVKFELFFC